MGGEQEQEGVDKCNSADDESLPPTFAPTPKFKEDYAKRVPPIISMVESLFDVPCGLCELPIVTHSPASNYDKVLQVLRKISPLVGDHLKMDSSNIKKHPELVKVLDIHTRGSAYFRQFF